MTTHQGMDLHGSWFLVRRRRLLIVGCVLGGLAFAFALNELTSPVYRSRIRVEVKREPTHSPLTGALTESPSPQSDNQAIYTAADMVTNRTLIGEVVSDMWQRGIPLEPGKRRWGLPASAQHGSGTGGAPVSTIRTSSQDTPPPDLERRIDWLLARISVEPLRDTRLIRIGVEHSDPLVAAEIANLTAQVFVRYQQIQRSEADTTLLSYLRGQAVASQRRVADLERKLHGSNQQGLFALEGQLRQQTQTAGELNDSYTKIRTERLAVSSRLAKLQSVSKDPLLDLEQIPIHTDALDALRRSLVASNTSLAKAKVTYGTQHPKLLALESENREIRRNIQTEIENAISSLKADRSILLAREESLRSAIDESEQEVRSVNSSVQQFSHLESELKSERDLYGLLTARLHDAEITGEIKSSPYRIVEPASVEPDPVRPRKALNLGIGLILGILFGTGLAFLQESLRRTIRTPQDVDQHLKLPVLGLIPRERLP